MAFRFALAPLLRLRRSLEHQRALALQRASFSLARAQDELAALERFLSKAATADSASLSKGRSAAELQFADLLREQFLRLRQEMQAQIRELESIRQQAALTYRQALRDREALERLRERQREAYQTEQSRSEQQELDAAFLLQRWHKRSG
jgi:flagellar export protein FliJ